MIARLLSVGGFTALSRVAGFIRDVLMAAILGAGPMSDAFMVAFRLPNNFRAIFAEGAFNAAFLPRYTAAATQAGTAPTSAATRFADDVFPGRSLRRWCCSFWRCCSCARSSPCWRRFCRHPDQMRLAVSLSRITFPFLLCIAIVTQLAAMMNALHKFRAAAASPILLNLAIVAALLASRYFPSPEAPAYAAAYGVFAAGIFELIFMVWVGSHSGIRLHLRLPRWGQDVKAFLTALGNATVGAGSVQIGLFIDTLIASFLPSGDLTALYYADRINQLPMGIIGVALGTVLLPEMSARTLKER
jgi:putative peptidoglycan lipid II flippase